MFCTVLLRDYICMCRCKFCIIQLPSACDGSSSAAAAPVVYCSGTLLQYNVDFS